MQHGISPCGYTLGTYVSLVVLDSVLMFFPEAFPADGGSVLIRTESLEK
jgi:hypothetical protein